MCIRSIFNIYLVFWLFISSVSCISNPGNPDANNSLVQGAIIRMDTTIKEIHLIFSGHEFADGFETIHKTLSKYQIKASFFFTGDFYRNQNFSYIINQLLDAGHYLGAHSDKHLLYASWENRDSLLVTKKEFIDDLNSNYQIMSRFGINKKNARYFLPPFEWYNDSIAKWTDEMGLTLINFTPGTSSNQDWSYPAPEIKYFSTDTIIKRILEYEKNEPNGLNGFILLSHIGTDPRRTDKFYKRLDELIAILKEKGYSFKSL